MNRTRIAAGSVAAAALALSVGLAASIGALVQGIAHAEAWYQSPAFFPLAAMLLTAVAAVGSLVRSWRQRVSGAAIVTGGQSGAADASTSESSADDDADEFDASASQPRRALAAIVLLLLYPLAVAFAGLVIGTMAFVTAIASQAGLPLRRALLVALLLALVLHAVFVLGFRVWFPEPWIIAAFKAGA